MADNNGKFTYSYDTALAKGTKITFNVKKDNDLIYATKVVEVVYDGEISVDGIPTEIIFTLNPISTSPILCSKEKEISFSVTDSRITSSNWKLYVSTNQDLTNDEKDVLNNSLVFQNDDGSINTLSTSPLLVYTGSDNGGNIKVTNIAWNTDEGILMQVNKPLKNDTVYKATLTWTIEE